MPNYPAITLDKLDNIERMLTILTNGGQSTSSQAGKEYLTVTESMEFLDCSKSHIYALQKKIPVSRIGGRRYFKRADLIEYLEKGRVLPESSKRSYRHG